MAVFGLEAAAASGVFDGLVLVVPGAADPADVDAILEAASLEIPIQIAVGGPTRQGSVRRGLASVPGEAEIVAVHDAARPFASSQLFARVIDALLEGSTRTGVDGVIPVIPSPDTIKRIREGRVIETIPRGEAALAQTPQAFVASVLRAAHDRAERDGLEGTDDAMLLEAGGSDVVTVPGESTNFKITTHEDLERAERLARALP
jgi:2-C-methyl-D-erythritol 4-phosphate cytidylyltransferase